MRNYDSVGLTRCLPLLSVLLLLAPQHLIAAEATATGPNIRLNTTYGAETYRPAEFVAGETVVVQAKTSHLKANAQGQYQFATEAQLLDSAGKTIEKIPLHRSSEIANSFETVHLSFRIPTETPPGKYRFLATLHDLMADTKTTAELEITLHPRESQDVTELRLTQEPATSLRPGATYLLANVSSELVEIDSRGVQCTMLIWDEKKRLIGEPISAIITKNSRREDETGRPYNLASPLPSLPSGNYQIRLLAPNEVGRESTQYQIQYRVPFYISGIDVLR
ncbi:hypothetical protein DTL42_16180 [Bremerella cremea]|uniref:DUF4198 domain-containing protein n=1 Tax=Bremerella cremea TaxID=1031537 RepID=A0A368KS47_9BACT|nr:hypothetical protein [Bremerella cremea]RCS46026.1 hypothetical protein DTL42_16180 [Bremerella cremea]